MSKYILFEKEKPELFLVRGHQGSGKSRLARNYVLFKNNVVLTENDSYFTNESGEYNFIPEKHQEAKEECFRKTKEGLMKGMSVVVANTFTTLSELEPYIDLSKEYGVVLNVVEMELMDFDSVHGVPDFVIQDKIKKFEHYSGAQRVTDNSYELVSGIPKDLLKLWNISYEYNLKYSRPEKVVNDLLNEVNFIISYHEKSILLLCEKDIEDIDLEKKDLLSFQELKRILLSGEIEDIKEKVYQMDTAIRELLPEKLFKLMNSSETELKTFSEILKGYGNNEDNIQEKDKKFTGEFIDSMLVQNKRKNTYR